MSHQAISRPNTSRHTIPLWSQVLIGAMGVLLAGLPAQAGESQTPWECSTYTGDAHTRCLAAFVEAQREQIATLQAHVQAQQDTVNQLKAQMDRQAAASAMVQQPLSQPPAIVQVVPPLYTYPPVGLGLYLGRPWLYGQPYYYRPYVYGPHYYGHRHRGHH